MRSPYHFAAILDRGRKKPANGTLQVWFLNALRDDPRLKYGYTRRRGMRPRLTKAEFLKWKRINASYPEGQKPMVIAKVTSRTKNVRGKYFQGRNTAAVHRATAKIVDEEVKRFIDDSLVYRTQDHGLVGGKRVEIEI